MGDLISFGPDYKIYISVVSASHGESIKGPLSKRSIGELVVQMLGVNEDIEIKIKKEFQNGLLTGLIILKMIGTSGVILSI